MSRVLTPEAEFDRQEFESEFGEDGNCGCHLWAPCNSCVHPGNPLNQNDNDTCWIYVLDEDGGAA